MLISTLEASTATPTIDANLRSFLSEVTVEYLQAVVERIAVPRHRIAEAKANEDVADWIESEFQRHRLNTYRQGQFGNVVGTFCRDIAEVRVLVGAHFDTVPGSPGADDNASAVAAMLGVAKALARSSNQPVGFIAFNREEDGLLGSKDFVRDLVENQTHRPELVHVLEMVGYSDDRPGSQQVPVGLPVKLSDRGNFIGVLANSDSNRLIKRTLSVAGQCVPHLPVTALKIFLGIEKFFPHLLRSDHSPFWTAKIPTLMWTDTAEFRNPNYHQPSDLPDTLNWSFLHSVTELLVAHVVDQLALESGLGED